MRNKVRMKLNGKAGIPHKRIRIKSAPVKGAAMDKLPNVGLRALADLGSVVMVVNLRVSPNDAHHWRGTMMLE